MTTGRLRRAFLLLLGSMLFSVNANAQLGVFERLVMPGPLSTAHAEYESDCGSCHTQFDRGSMRQQCLDCHKEIAEDLATSTGFHSLSPEVGDRPCIECHEDHEGRDADIVGLDEDAFDHELTDFPLLGRHTEVVCEDCHEAGMSFHDAETDCVSCHLEDDQHRGNLGPDCADCHSEVDWAETSFDHLSTSDYELTGRHSEITCVSCHVDEQYENTPSECIGCHQEDDSHMGKNGIECQDCHNTIDWAESLFDHFTKTGFALTGAHSEIECESCHTGNKFENSLESDCYSCHAEDDSHNGVNGTACGDCHRATEWPDVSFDHNRDTDFELHDAHADLSCDSCHVEPVADALPATTCFGCHAEDDPHEGQLGESCETCHGELEFTVDVRFDHDLTQFPLLGRHDEAECEDCHETHAFLDAPTDCIGCHADDDAHEDRLGADCAFCHTSSDWLLYFFDHNAQTDFLLDGAHAGLDCLACHREPLRGDAISLATTCGSCHRRDDVHDGEFGPDCEQCHTTESFGVLRDVR